MRTHARYISCMLVIILLTSSPSYDWNTKGHMMVAAIAYDKLKPEVKAKVDELLRLNPDRRNWLALIPDGTKAENPIKE